MIWDDFVDDLMGEPEFEIKTLDSNKDVNDQYI
jgi:hypothetical protein